jgi:hypothetical protein
MPKRHATKGKVAKKAAQPARESKRQLQKIKERMGEVLLIVVQKLRDEEGIVIDLDEGTARYLNEEEKEALPPPKKGVNSLGEGGSDFSELDEEEMEKIENEMGSVNKSQNTTETSPPAALGTRKSSVNNTRNNIRSSSCEAAAAILDSPPSAASAIRPAKAMKRVSRSLELT